MRTAYRLPVPLIIAGLALLVCALRSGHPAASASAAAPVAYVPPAVSTPAPAASAVRVTTGEHERAHTAAHPARAPKRHGHHVAAPRPTAPATASTRPAASPPKPRPKPARTRPAATYVSGPTHWSALNGAIARIPTYRSGAAHWVVSTKYDFWGTADWYHDVLYVDPSVPVDKLYDVAVHEWSHELSVLDYSGDVVAATRAMNATFGGHGLTGPERAADCMSILQGATWTHYTTCSNAAWRAAAARLVAGKTL
jgi:hypothetical protein